MSTPLSFGPEYPHTETVFKRDKGSNVIVPWDYTLPEFEYLTDLDWVWTEKVDGTNIRLHRPKRPMFDQQSRPVIGGRTDRANVPQQLVKNLDSWLDPDLWSETFGNDNVDITLYGEGYGAGIQKGGGNYGADQRFILFDVRIGDWWLKRDDVESIAGSMGLDIVPILGTMSLTKAILWVQGKAELGHEGSLQSCWPGVEIEGLVGEPVVPLRTRRGDRIKTKVKVRDWAEYFRRKQIRASA